MSAHARDARATAQAEAGPQPPIAVLLMGPTGAGKTELALALAERLPLDVISVDSALVYRGMDIGTAKPHADVLARTPHRLIDILDPSRSYSAERFRRDALRELADIERAGRSALFVGGTMLYFRTLQRGLARLPDADPELRAKLDAHARREGWPALHAGLAQVDPQAASRIHPHDAQRIQRALEVYELTGKPLSVLQAAAQETEIPRRRWLKLALAPASRHVLHERIARRFEHMLEAGLIEEVRTLHARGDLDLHLSSVRAVGYRQLWPHVCGEVSRSAAVQAAIDATRQLAKRQLTWLRAESGVMWLDSEDRGRYTRAVEQVTSAVVGGSPVTGYSLP
jgi:tRNA dimethylallyltransferase